MDRFKVKFLAYKMLLYIRISQLLGVFGQIFYKIGCLKLASKCNKKSLTMAFECMIFALEAISYLVPND